MSILVIGGDYLGNITDLAYKVKEETREKGIKTVFARRAWSHIHSTLVKEV